jgi:hypothetical protein
MRQKEFGMFEKLMQRWLHGPTHDHFNPKNVMNAWMSWMCYLYATNIIANMSTKEPNDIDVILYYFISVKRTSWADSFGPCRGGSSFSTAVIWHRRPSCHGRVLSKSPWAWRQSHDKYSHVVHGWQVLDTVHCHFEKRRTKVQPLPSKYTLAANLRVGQYILSRMLSRTRINYHNYRSEKIIIISDTMTKSQQTDTMTIKWPESQ